MLCGLGVLFVWLDRDMEEEEAAELALTLTPVLIHLLAWVQLYPMLAGEQPLPRQTHPRTTVISPEFLQEQIHIVPVA